jgi:hypothetical protein
MPGSGIAKSSGCPPEFLHSGLRRSQSTETDKMARLSKKAIIRQILTDYGYRDWCIVELASQYARDSASKCILFNFGKRRKAELAIPNHWFQHGCPLIGESITVAIQNSKALIADLVEDRDPGLTPHRFNRSSAEGKHFSIPDLFHRWGV